MSILQFNFNGANPTTNCNNVHHSMELDKIRKKSLLALNCWRLAAILILQHIPTLVKINARFVQTLKL